MQASCGILPSSLPTNNEGPETESFFPRWSYPFFCPEMTYSRTALLTCPNLLTVAYSNFRWALRNRTDSGAHRGTSAVTTDASSPGCKESGAKAEHSPHLVPRLNGDIPPHSHTPSWLAKKLPYLYHIHLKVITKKTYFIETFKTRNIFERI
jgi:hypothetical protein